MSVIKTPRFFLLTFGCQMNKNDSERIVSLLCARGWHESAGPDAADLLLINTCSVRQSAEDRVYNIILNWQKLRINNPQLVIGVTGCMPGRDQRGNLRRKLAGVDLFFPIDELVFLPARLHTLNPELYSPTESNISNYLSITPSRSTSYRAFVAIQTGCNNFCTYCVVPYARGRELCRRVADIIAEVQAAAIAGAKEVVLLGQVVNNYRAPDREKFSHSNPFASRQLIGSTMSKSLPNRDFAALLWEINQVEAIERVHWTAADPRFFNEYLLQALLLPKQINYLHLPVQSGDNNILKKMNRHYTREFYLELVGQIRCLRPSIALGTDIIVGFCDESEAQFENTLDLYRKCDFDISYHARYSARSGTVAAQAFVDNVSRTVKKARWMKLQALMENITARKNQVYLNQIVNILVEQCDADGRCSGYSSEMKLVHFMGDSTLIGQVVAVKINWVDTWLLRGNLVV